MRIIRVVIIAIIISCALFYGVYYIGTNLASEKLMDVVSSELVNSGEIENIKQTIESDPELKALLENTKSINQSTLPFTTKEEAIKVLVQNVGITELQAIQSRVEEGSISKEEILQEFQDKLTDEEITALKLIAYKELYNQ
ncbi:hypothetical protein M3204_03570 [Mesobacillus subterraneus]|uniref:hypothetical protein n=1 Tax=Mesobacillus subterraneus TaxID=285983 RepID=UPI00203DA622|nr:hypothetical protein [Mesobacillus subterraneus]MCM3663466.1 hypothetical protein [Mesobacillus subterraneus]MCM3683236.1 hypothetical protein [Mesobacillus subterraneus]